MSVMCSRFARVLALLCMVLASFVGVSAQAIAADEPALPLANVTSPKITKRKNSDTSYHANYDKITYYGTPSPNMVFNKAYIDWLNYWIPRFNALLLPNEALEIRNDLGAEITRPSEKYNGYIEYFKYWKITLNGDVIHDGHIFFYQKQSNVTTKTTSSTSPPIPPETDFQITRNELLQIIKNRHQLTHAGRYRHIQQMINRLDHIITNTEDEATRTALKALLQSLKRIPAPPQFMLSVFGNRRQNRWVRAAQATSTSVARGYEILAARLNLPMPTIDDLSLEQSQWLVAANESTQNDLNVLGYDLFMQPDFDDLYTRAQKQNLRVRIDINRSTLTPTADLPVGVALFKITLALINEGGVVQGEVVERNFNIAVQSTRRKGQVVPLPTTQNEWIGPMLQHFESASKELLNALKARTVGDTLQVRVAVDAAVDAAAVAAETTAAPDEAEEVARVCEKSLTTEK